MVRESSWQDPQKISINIQVDRWEIGSWNWENYGMSGDDLTLCSICQDERCTPWQTQKARFLEVEQPEIKLSGNSKFWTLFPSYVQYANLWHKIAVYLNNGYVQKNSAQPDSYGGSSHDRWTHEEPNSHRECSEFVPAGNDSRLQCHEQAWKNTQLSACSY